MRVISMSKKQDLIFGINPVLETLKASSQDLLEILVSEGSSRPALHLVRQEARRRGVRLLSVGSKTLDHLVRGQRHQGVIARVQAYRYLSFADLIERIGGPSTPERILILDGLTDPRNFGALLRTADGAGVRNIVIPKDRSVDVTPVAMKASAGAARHVNIVKVTNLRRAIAELKGHGYWVIGLDAKSKDTIYETSFPQRLAILVGNEGTGARPINLRECDLTVSIPMLGKVSSLNVSVAGAVCLYELLRQARKSMTDVSVS
jgi:23S rRNA (guanosine2251-2'-O)-methyltransferase